MVPNNDMHCKTCFWFVKKSRPKQIYCILYDHFNRENCEGYIKNETQSDIIQTTKEQLGLENEEFIFLSSEDPSQFYNMDAEKQSAECCILAKCQPSRTLLDEIEGCIPFRRLFMKKIGEVLNTTDLRVITQKYEELFSRASENIKKMYESAHKKSNKAYLHKKILLATALYHASVDSGIKITQWDWFEWFPIASNSITKYTRVFLKTIFFVNMDPETKRRKKS